MRCTHAVSSSSSVSMVRDRCVKTTLLLWALGPHGDVRVHGEEWNIIK